MAKKSKKTKSKKPGGTKVGNLLSKAKAVVQKAAATKVGKIAVGAAKALATGGASLGAKIGGKKVAPAIAKVAPKVAGAVKGVVAKAAPVVGRVAKFAGRQAAAIATGGATLAPRLIPRIPRAKAAVPQPPVVRQPGVPEPTPARRVTAVPTIPGEPGEPTVPTSPPIPEPISKEFTEPKLEVPVTEEPVPEITPPPVEQLPETPVTPTPFGPSAYTGPSIVDYLASKGQQNSFSSRRQLAAQFGIQGYTGTAEQNTQLLNTLRGQTGTPAPEPTPTPPTPTPEPTPEVPEPEPLTPIEEEYADFLKQKSYDEIYNELADGAGLNDMKDRLKEFEDKLQAVRDKIIAKKEDINVNPWISESLRMRKISAAEATFAEEERNALSAWEQANKIYEDSVAEIQFRAKMAVQKQDEDRDFYFKVKEASRKTREDAQRAKLTTAQIGATEALEKLRLSKIGAPGKAVSGKMNTQIINIDGKKYLVNKSTGDIVKEIRPGEKIPKVTQGVTPTTISRFELRAPRPVLAKRPGFLQRVKSFFSKKGKKSKMGAKTQTASAISPAGAISWDSF